MVGSIANQSVTIGDNCVGRKLKMFAVYARCNRRFDKKFTSRSCFSRKYQCTAITSAYQQLSKITYSRLYAIRNPTDGCAYLNIAIRNLRLSNLFSQEAGMSDEGNKRVLDYEEILKAQKDDKVLIIDVREQSEINETGKLPGSIHIPMGNVSGVLLNLPEDDFKERYGRHKPTKNTKIIFSCRSGKRSAMVLEAVQKLGYENVYNYTGGWMDWESKRKV